ncbi:MAG: hypothetical protein ACPLXL_01400 [Minisyncoccia bacterium]
MEREKNSTKENIKKYIENAYEEVSKNYPSLPPILICGELRNNGIEAKYLNDTTPINFSEEGKSLVGKSKDKWKIEFNGKKFKAIVTLRWTKREIRGRTKEDSKIEDIDKTILDSEIEDIKVLENDEEFPLRG